MDIKRISDIIFSLVFLIILSPIMIAAVILIFAESRGSIFFNQMRVGRNRKEFILYKFRTMIPDYEAEKNFDSDKDEDRITGLGRLLRRTKIDELPQLINVLKGDMSIVGPRPTIKIQVDQYTERQMKRLSVRPGMTGLAQVCGGNALSWNERIEYDIYYIEHMSILLDIKIFFKTIVVILLGEQKFLMR